MDEIAKFSILDRKTEFTVLDGTKYLFSSWTKFGRKFEIWTKFWTTLVILDGRKMTFGTTCFFSLEFVMITKVCVVG